MNEYRNRQLQRNDQKGVVLFMSLVMLLILTILGLSSVQTTSLQERMSRNARDTNLAFQAAESALRDGEDLLELLNSRALFDAGTTGYYYDNDPGVNPNWRDVDWTAASAAGCGCLDGDTAITGVASQPRYVVEHVREVISDADALNLDNIGQDTGSGRTQIFKVTTFGVGGTSTAQVMLQGTYGKRF
jgi:type IV pilus assembly protein PilX